jgi:peptide/nickel transport system substrate-binding protein
MPAGSSRRSVLRNLGAGLFGAIALLQGGGTAAAKGGPLVYVTGTDALTLDPQFVTDVPTARVVMQVHETLVYPQENGEMKGVLAESWSVADDGRTWTFKLRDGVRFHDGTPFNAGAVKFTFDRIMNPETGSPRRSASNSIESVETVDDRTVVIRTKTPFAPFLAQLSAYNLAVISPTAGKVPTKDYSLKPSGTGPFKLRSRTPGEQTTLAANDDYWRGRPTIDALEIRIVPEDSARVLMLLAGEAQVAANIPPVMMTRLKSAAGVEVIRKTGYRTMYIGMNLRMPPFDNPKVRQAVAHAINTKALIEGVMSGVATPGGGLESPEIPGATAFAPYPYDPAKAKALLAEAGLPDGFSTEFYVPTGRYINDRQIGEAIQAQLAQVGIKVSIRTPEWGAYVALLEDRHKVPLYLIGKGSPTGDLDLTLGLIPESKGSMNYSNYSNPEVDRRVVEQRGIVDLAKRKEVLREILADIYQDTPFLVLFYEDQLFGKRTNVKDVRVLANESVDFSHARIE